VSINVGEVADLTVAAEEQGVDLTLYSNIKKAFVNKEAAFAYLLFILLYAPCAAAMGAIVREVGASWAKFVAIWSTAIAYIISVAYYQIATFSHNPMMSVMYVLASSIIVFTVIYSLKKKGNLLADISTLSQEKLV